MLQSLPVRPIINCWRLPFRSILSSRKVEMWLWTERICLSLIWERNFIPWHRTMAFMPRWLWLVHLSTSLFLVHLNLVSSTRWFSAATKWSWVRDWFPLLWLPKCSPVSVCLASKSRRTTWKTRRERMCRFTRITVLLCYLLTTLVICAIIPHMKRQTRYKDVLISRQRDRCLSPTTVTKMVATWNIRQSGFRRFPIQIW